MESLRKPLLRQESAKTEESSVSGEDAGRRAKADFPVSAIGAVALLAVGGISTSLIALIAVPSAIVYTACGVCIFTSPWVVAKQYSIAKGSGIGRSVNHLRDQANQLKKQQEVLEEAVEDLQEDIELLSYLRGDLGEITGNQDFNVNEAVSLFRENEDILEKIKAHIREIAVADVARYVIRSDTNGDMKITLKELPHLTLRIKLKLRDHGVDLDEKRFMAMVRKDNDISHVLKVIGAILFKEKIDDEELDEYAAAALRDVDRQNELIGTLKVTSAVGRFRRLATAEIESLERDLEQFAAEEGFATVKEEEDDDDAEKMLLLQERFARGSVRLAHGKKLSLVKKVRRKSIVEDIAEMGNSAVTRRRSRVAARRRSRPMLRGMASRTISDFE